MIKPFKMKHIPSGLYFQPMTTRGSNLSKRGKIYQTNVDRFFNCDDIIKAHKDTQVYKLTKDLLPWELSYNSTMALKVTAKDWEVEYV